MSKTEHLIQVLPDPESAQRFLDQLAENHPSQWNKLLKNDGLLSDVLTLVSYSPLLAATFLQNPDYLWWLNRKRSDFGVRGKDELLESLARFSLTNSQLEPQIYFARFRRRELLRIFLRDIRRLGTIAEITEEISNLADAILEHALRIARQELDNRYGSPLEIDDKNRERPARFCIVSLGKLGSKELNYSSDIDLLFIYSADGSTSGTGSRGSISNREYFGRLAESVSKLVGQQAGEGAAYRVDLRLRPHGRVGALALSTADTIRYYKAEARDWERQVLIRSRPSAGNTAIYRSFFSNVEDSVFNSKQSVKDALKSVRESKAMIDLEHRYDKGYNVKLGKGGIREIEFIAQALQLAFGGDDEWLRSPHTLISLSRLADRKHLSEAELNKLSEAYPFLRHLEHILQMEHGLQTHLVPTDKEKRSLIAKRIGFEDANSFEKGLFHHSDNVHRIFERIFGGAVEKDHDAGSGSTRPSLEFPSVESSKRDSGDGFVLSPQLLTSFERSDVKIDLTPAVREILTRLQQTSPKFTALLAASPALVNGLHLTDRSARGKDFLAALKPARDKRQSFGLQLSELRKAWAQLLLEIAVLDIFEIRPLSEIKQLQTSLAKTSIAAALQITAAEISRRLGIEVETIHVAVLALGKLAAGGIDYDSDLDLVFVYNDRVPIPAGNLSHAEFFGLAVEIFVATLSSITRDGHLYRVDLRLRPHGKDGPSAISQTAFFSYFRADAAIWELLAYVKIGKVGGDLEFAGSIQTEIRKITHERALAMDDEALRGEIRRIRSRLEEEKTPIGRASEVDIKVGSGGMLDVYFIVRYLQLRDNLPDGPGNRSTDQTLARLRQHGSLSSEQLSNLVEGYRFLSALDHNLRLTLGRSPRLPVADNKALDTIADRMQLDSKNKLFELLTLHRLNIRSVFTDILGE